MSRKPEFTPDFGTAVRDIDSSYEPDELRNPVPWPFIAIALALAVWGGATIYLDDRSTGIGHEAQLARRAVESGSAPAEATDAEVAQAEGDHTTAQGAALFGTYCATCHQANGAGVRGAMLFASAALLLVGLFGQRIFSAVIRIRQTVIFSIIIFLCVTGAYMEGGGMFGVYLMLIFGFIGYFMKKFDYSFVTFVVGYVLGPMAELTIRQSMIISDGSPAALLDRPIAILFLCLTVLAVWRFAIAGARSIEPARPSTPQGREN